MPSERTVVTELATGLGMLGPDDLATVIARRPGTLSNLTTANWDQLTAIDRVYLVSCKYLSRILHNPSPGPPD